MLTSVRSFQWSGGWGALVPAYTENFCSEWSEVGDGCGSEIRKNALSLMGENTAHVYDAKKAQ